MREFLRRHTISFTHAFDGLCWAIRTQPNFRVHLTLSFIALLLSWYLAVSFTEVIIIVFTIILGLTCEMINTSLEAMTDLITTEYKKEAKIAKDVAAGMMLLTAMSAVIIAVLVFGPRLVQLFS